MNEWMNEWMNQSINQSINENTKQQQANKIRPYKYPRFCKYVLHKIQGHSRQHNCFVFNLK